MRVLLDMRRKARTRLAEWFDVNYGGVLLQNTGVLARPLRQVIGETEWQPIEETSFGPTIGRAKYELIEECYFWHLEDIGEFEASDDPEEDTDLYVAVENEPRFRIVQGSKRTQEEYYP